jgi:hypothetical protein
MSRLRRKLLSASPKMVSRLHKSSRFYRRKQEPETAEEIDADIELILGRKGGASAATQLHFGTSNDYNSNVGSEADVTVRPGGDDDSEVEVAQDLLIDADEE